MSSYGLHAEGRVQNVFYIRSGEKAVNKIKGLSPLPTVLLMQKEHCWSVFQSIRFDVKQFSKQKCVFFQSKYPQIQIIKIYKLQFYNTIGNKKNGK